MAKHVTLKDILEKIMSERHAGSAEEEDQGVRPAEITLRMTLADAEGRQELIFDGSLTAAVRLEEGGFVAVNGLNNAEGSGPSVAAALFRLLESSLAIQGLADQRDTRQAREKAEALFCVRCETVEGCGPIWDNPIALAQLAFRAIGDYLDASSAHTAEHVRRLDKRFRALVRADPELNRLVEAATDSAIAVLQGGKVPTAEANRPRPHGFAIVPAEGIGNH